MFCKSFCATIIGVDASIVQVEADVCEGMPVFNLVGLLNSEVKEARERVRSAIRNLGFRFPPKRVTLNMSPADIRKEGTAFDLSIAFALMGAFEYVPVCRNEDVMFIGELSLDGHINRVNGVLPMVIAAKKHGFRYCMVPQENVTEGTLVDGIGIIGVDTLGDAVSIIRDGSFDTYVCKKTEWRPEIQYNDIKDFSDVSGQHLIRRAVEIAAAGGHNILMIGPPGAGKTMIAERIAGIMPELTIEESLEVSQIYSVCGELKNTGYMYTRPFRSPHHTIPRTGLIGGGSYPLPGEICLAHKGVLFLDELTEFPRSIIELLRQPLESDYIIHARSNATIKYPCEFLLAAAMNPCPCGYYPDKKRCTCSPLQIKRYLGKISQAFLDRIDMIVDVKAVRYDQLGTDNDNESSEAIRIRVSEAFRVQQKRYKDTIISNNSRLGSKGIAKWCNISEEDRGYIKMVYEEAGMSARSYYKLLRVARTIADLEGERSINRKHLTEAVYYRTLDKTYRIMDGDGR